MALNLLQRPREDLRFETPHTTVPTVGYIQQADLLFLPEDPTDIKGHEKQDKADLAKVNKIRKEENHNAEPLKSAPYHYLLVCVDLATGKMDCEPIKFKYSFIVLEALKSIYARKILSIPHELEVDAGTEFQSQFQQYFHTKTHVRVKESGRHRQQAVVESINGIISKIIQTRMLAEELNTNETATNWVEDVPKIVELYNKYYVHKPPTMDLDKADPIKVKEKSSASDILEVGTPVRIQLDNPETTDERRLHGKLRVGDRRWTKRIGKITQFYLRPNFPPMYQVDNNTNVAYTKNQLQVVKKNEKQPSSKAHKKWIVEEILGKIEKKNQPIKYKVKWSDGSTTEEPREQLLVDIPMMVNHYEEQLALAKSGKVYPTKILDKVKQKNKWYYKVMNSNKTESLIPRTTLLSEHKRLVELYEHSLKFKK